MTLITDPVPSAILGGILADIAVMLCLYVVWLLLVDYGNSLTPDPAVLMTPPVRDWPQRLTPTDLAEAYLDHDEAPTVERHFDWSADPYVVWATQRLDEIKVDVRDWMPAGMAA